MSDPAQSGFQTWPIADGWRIGTRGNDVGIAHLYLDGHSRCHLWMTTILDRPARAGDERCPVCKELADAE